MLIIREAESQVEDVLCHVIHNDSLVVSDPVLQVNNA